MRDATNTSYDAAVFTSEMQRRHTASFTSAFGPEEMLPNRQPIGCTWQLHTEHQALLSSDKMARSHA